MQRQITVEPECLRMFVYSRGITPYKKTRGNASKHDIDNFEDFKKFNYTNIIIFQFTQALRSEMVSRRDLNTAIPSVETSSRRDNYYYCVTLKCVTFNRQNYLLVGNWHFQSKSLSQLVMTFSYIYIYIYIYASTDTSLKCVYTYNT